MKERINFHLILLVTALVVALLTIVVLGQSQVYKKFLSLSAKLTPQQSVAASIKQGAVGECDRYSSLTIDGVNYRTVCRNNITRNKALSDLDYRLCKGLDDRLMPIRPCEQEVVGKKIEGGATLEYCNTIDDLNLRAFCTELYWQSAAVRASNPKLCQNLKGEGEESCSANVFFALASKDPRLVDCRSVPASMQKDCTALKQNASKPRAERTCGKITDVILAQICADY